ncbi:hypothetical protein DPMN_101752 [Dreissena polymorpha]|uniref:Uncharacterized protein n=1 Tax=Dreissena polymorpha TaxID=45954 RepID=A0A9D4LJD6_DREPO|nr:hypothetical protein DPMN_101752 [Dreissena polymorpha]
MSGNPRKRPRNVSDDVDVTRCIICQNETKYPTTGTERGRIAIQEAAEIRKDIVHDRLLRLDNNNFGLKYNTISTDAVNDNCGNNIDNDTSNDSDIGDENETLDSAKGNHDDDDDYDDEEEEDDNVDAYVDENDETIHDHVVVFTASVKVGNQMAAARTYMYFFQYQ